MRTLFAHALFALCSRKGVERVDQPELTRHFDLHAARTTASFDKLWRDIERLLSELELSRPDSSDQS